MDEALNSLARAFAAKPLYHGGKERVALGDRVRLRVLFRRETGTVVYVPGVSRQNPHMEYNGLCWVGIRLESGGFVGTVVHPKTAWLKRKVQLLGRGAGTIGELGPDSDPFAEGPG